MERTYTISGMTCGGCVVAVKKSLEKVEGVQHVSVDLSSGSVTIDMQQAVAPENLASALHEKYTLKQVSEVHKNEVENLAEKLKWQQLKPLFLVFAFLVLGVGLMNWENWHIGEVMLDFMGLFYLVFSFFKFLDLKGFAKSFRMYDPLAKKIPAYGKVYPFIELGLGILFLLRSQITFALLATLFILGITTVGVVRVLLDKRTIQCACLGTALKLPMTEATLIENALMLGMAVMMLLV